MKHLFATRGARRTWSFLCAIFFVVIGSSAARAQTASDRRWPDVSRPVPVTADGADDAAVVVGIDEYVFVPHVPGAVTNATDWYSFLVESRKVPIDKVHLLRNAQGTREGILKMAGVAAKEVQPRGTLWFIFIGHGGPSRDGNDGVLIGADAQQDADSIFARSVAQQEIITALGAARTPNRVMILDACFSGRTGTGAPIAAGLQPLIRVKELPSTQNVVVLSAGAADQFAGPLPGSNRPAFSYLMLGALRGWAGTTNGEVTTTDSMNYARKVLNMMPIGRTQEPKIAGGIPNTTLSRHATERGPDLHAMVVGKESRSATVVVPREPQPTEPDDSDQGQPQRGTPQPRPYSPPASYHPYTPPPSKPPGPPEGQPNPWRSTLAYTAIGFGILAVGAGTVAQEQVDAAKQKTGTDFTNTKQSAMTYAIVSDVSLGITIASVIGIILLPAKVQVAVTPSRNGAMFGAQRSF